MVKDDWLPSSGTADQNISYIFFQVQNLSLDMVKDDWTYSQVLQTRNVT